MTTRKPLPPVLAGAAFRSREAQEWGVSRGRLRAGDLTKPLHGVRVGVDVELSDIIELCRAVALVLGTEQVFSHSTALALWHVPLPKSHAPRREEESPRRTKGPARPTTDAPLPEAEDVVVHVGTRGEGRMRRPGVVGHQIPRETAIRATPDGPRAVAPADAWCQFAGQPEVTLLDLIVAGDFLITQARQAGGYREPAPCSIAELRSAVARYGSRRGARMLAEAVEAIRSGPGSSKESELRWTLIEAGLGEPVIGHRILTRLGPLEPDLAYPDRRVLLEYEGDGHRTILRQWRGDFERVRAFQEAGWTVIRVNADDLSDKTRRTALLAQLRGLLLAP